MKAVIEIDPENANALNYLGYTYADIGKNLDEAERLVKLALQYKPEDGYITDSLGWIYFKKGKLDQALLLLQKAVTLIPEDPTILEHLGDVYMKLDKREKALEYYKDSLKHRKNDNEIIKNKIKGAGGTP